jgi:hypothetical protein
MFDESDDRLVAKQSCTLKVDDVNHKEIAHNVCLGKLDKFSRGFRGASWGSISS